MEMQGKGKEKGQEENEKEKKWKGVAGAAFERSAFTGSRLFAEPGCPDADEDGERGDADAGFLCGRCDTEVRHGDR